MLRNSMRDSRFATLLALALLPGACAPAPRDGACELQTATAPLPRALREASGAALSASGRLWVIADSGEPVLFAVGHDNAIVARVRVADTIMGDWEDLARGPCPDGSECLFIGDIGDNLHMYDARAVLRVREPLPTDSVVVAERFPFRFPDGPSDAEALAALPDGSLLVVTKGRNRAITAYRYPAPLHPDSLVTLERMGELSPGIVQVPLQATGADATADGEFLLLRGYAWLQFYRIDADLLEPVGRPIDLTPLGEAQGEGIALGAGGDVVLVGESADGGTIARLRCVLPGAAGPDARHE
jgi:hypothetical protein